MEARPLNSAHLDSYYHGFVIIHGSFISHMNIVQSNSWSQQRLWCSNHILKIYLETLESNFPKVVGYYLSNINLEWEDISKPHRIFIFMQKIIN